jgi:hypothetical protein
MNNYIGKVDAEWVDPKVELPPDGWTGLARREHCAEITRGAYWYGGIFRDENHNSLLYVGAWLRIGGPSTSILREQVQAKLGQMAVCCDEAALEAETDLDAQLLGGEGSGYRRVAKMMGTGEL